MKDNNSFYDLDEAVSRYKDEISPFLEKLNIVPKKAGHKVSFKLNDIQKQWVKDFHVRSVTLKPRQVGLTTIGQGTGLFIAAKVRYGNWGIASVKDSHAKKALEEMKQMVRDANPDLGIKIDPNCNRADAFRILPSETMIIAETGSSDNPFRGYSMMGLLVTEAAYWTGDITAFESFEKAVPVGGLIIMESTPRGTNNLFYQKYITAKKNLKPELNQYKALFYPWFRHKEYSIKHPKSFKMTNEELEIKGKYLITDDQIYWRRTELPGYPNCAQHDRLVFASSYPTDDLTCWGETVDSPFDSEKLIRMATFTYTEGEKGERIYVHPIPGERCFAGVDPARNGRDESSIVIINSRNEIVCVYQKNIHYTRFLHVCEDLLKRYNCKTYFEQNSFGLLLSDTLKERQVRGIVEWTTSESSKYTLFGNISEFIRDSNDIYDVFLQEQLQMYDCSVKDNKDDVLMAFGMALECKKAYNHYDSTILIVGGDTWRQNPWKL